MSATPLRLVDQKINPGYHSFMVFAHDTGKGYRLAGPVATEHTMPDINQAFEQYAGHFAGPDDADTGSGVMKVLYPVLGVITGVVVAMGGLWAIKKVRKG